MVLNFWSCSIIMLYSNVYVCSFDCCEKLDILVTLLAIIILGLCFTRLVFVVCNVNVTQVFCQQNNESLLP